MLDTISQFELKDDGYSYYLEAVGCVKIHLGVKKMWKYNSDGTTTEFIDPALEEQMWALRDVLHVITHSENNAERVFALKKLLTDPELQIYISITNKQITLGEFFKLAHKKVDEWSYTYDWKSLFD